jgi:hypothetical protein
LVPLCRTPGKASKSSPGESADFVLPGDLSCANLYSDGLDEAEEVPAAHAGATVAAGNGLPGQIRHPDEQLILLPPQVDFAPLLMFQGHDLPAEEFLSHNRHLGDSPMQRTWKRILCYTTFSAALALGPGLAWAGNPEPQAATTDAQRLEELDKQVKELKKSMADAVKSLGKIEKDLKDLHGESLVATQDALSRIQRLSDDFEKLKIEVENLRSRPASPSRISGFGPSDTAASTNGRVELVNAFPQEVSVVVNNRVYRLLPNEIRLTDPLPAGSFTYEVLGVTERRARTLQADKVFPIYIHQQQ